MDQPHDQVDRYQALPNPEDRSPLKALLAQDALVHPDHPLRREGVEGAELYLGKLASNTSSGQ